MYTNHPALALTAGQSPRSQRGSPLGAVAGRVQTPEPNQPEAPWAFIAPRQSFPSSALESSRPERSEGHEGPDSPAQLFQLLEHAR